MGSRLEEAAGTLGVYDDDIRRFKSLRQSLSNRIARFLVGRWLLAASRIAGAVGVASVVASADTYPFYEGPDRAFSRPGPMSIFPLMTGMIVLLGYYLTFQVIGTLIDLTDNYTIGVLYGVYDARGRGAGIGAAG